ncbi:hypothetical protein OG521_00140 [Streptomyces sp. NBC_01463]
MRVRSVIAAAVLPAATLSVATLISAYAATPAAHAHGAASARAEKAGLCRIMEFNRVNDEIGHYSAVLTDSSGPIRGQVVEFETNISDVHLGSVESGPDGRVELDLRSKLDTSTNEGQTLYGQLLHAGLRAHSTVPGTNIECSATRTA